MPRLTIDGRPVTVAPGATILDAARQLGIPIPTLCHREDLEPSASCMVCVVSLKPAGRLVPSCAMRAEEGMEVESGTAAVRDARRAALELLLSDHVGDCVAPCQRACPAHMRVPRMLRQIARGDDTGALATVREHIALPGILGRICPAPCEKACRRSAHDAPVAICLLKRFAADAGTAPVPTLPPPTGKRVAIIGAGPAGSAAAYHLLREGIAPTVFDAQVLPGGALHQAGERLPAAVIAAECGRIRDMGAVFRMGTTVGRDITLEELRAAFDAVLIAAGTGGPAIPGLAYHDNGMPVDKATRQTGLAGVFAAGNAVTPGRMAVRAVADGRAAALAIGRFLAGAPPAGDERLFNCHIGRLLPGEMELFLAGAAPGPRVVPAAGPAGGFGADEARAEARRCLHCDCRKAETCGLRTHAGACHAQIHLFHSAAPQGGEERRRFEQFRDGSRLIYEPGKCIACGICVQITARAGEELGLAFTGRGFGLRVAVPFRRPLGEGVRTTAAACAEACPTGALVTEQDQ